MAERLIYERETGHKYTIENGYERSDGQGGRIIRQGLMAVFTAISDINPTAEFDATKAAEKYAEIEVTSGRADYKDREKIIAEREARIKSFIENHEHFTRPGGMGLIWKKKTQEQLIAEREASIKAQIESLEDMKKKMNEVSDAALEELTKPERKDDPLYKPVTVTTGPATSNTARVK